LNEQWRHNHFLVIPSPAWFLRARKLFEALNRALAEGSGGVIPRESMPKFVQDVMLAAPTTHFGQLPQAILYRGAGIEVIWKPFLILLVIGSILFCLALARFRKTISQIA
jgi:hypothetical protein